MKNKVNSAKALKANQISYFWNRSEACIKVKSDSEFGFDEEWKRHKANCSQKERLSISELYQNAPFKFVPALHSSNSEIMPLPGEFFQSKSSVQKSDSVFGFDRSWRERHNIADLRNSSIFSRAFHGIVLPPRFDDEYNSVDRSIIRYPIFFPFLVTLSLATNFFKHYDYLVMEKHTTLYEIWRFWTYSLVCESWTGFYISTAYQLFVCCPYEIVFGSKSSIITYNLGILLASIFFMLQSSDKILIGTLGGNISIAIPLIYLALRGLIKADIMQNIIRILSHILWMAGWIFAKVRKDQLCELYKTKRCDMTSSGAVAGIIIGLTVGVGLVLPKPWKQNTYLQSSLIFILSLVAWFILIIFLLDD